MIPNRSDWLNLTAKHSGTPSGARSGRTGGARKWSRWAAAAASGWLLGAGVPRAAEYQDDGIPTAREEEVRWLLNRGRFDSKRENAARGTSYTDVPARSGPLAPHQSLSRAAHRHSADMAAKNVMQHQTVRGSAYYDFATQPTPWDRMEAEGYEWTGAGENVAAGYGTAESMYLGWWTSTGHRKNMYNPNLLEIGTGYAYSSRSTYKHYGTMSLGSSGGAIFFTDTLFSDADRNGRYTQGEGVNGIVISLTTAAGPHSAWDRSTPVGSYAVPLRDLRTGSVVKVGLRNESNVPVSLSVPRDYATLGPLTLAPGENREIGTFTLTSAGTNYGLRDLAPLPAPAPEPGLSIQPVDGGVRLSWNSGTGWRYRLQRSPDLEHWADLTMEPAVGTGSRLSHTDSGALARGLGFYRLVIEVAAP